MKKFMSYKNKETLQTIIVYEFDDEEEMKNSGLLFDNRRTTCFISSGKYYVGGIF